MAEGKRSDRSYGTGKSTREQMYLDLGIDREFFDGLNSTNIPPGERLHKYHVEFVTRVSAAVEKATRSHYNELAEEDKKYFVEIIIPGVVEGIWQKVGERYIKIVNSDVDKRLKGMATEDFVHALVNEKLNEAQGVLISAVKIGVKDGRLGVLEYVQEHLNYVKLEDFEGLRGDFDTLNGVVGDFTRELGEFRQGLAGKANIVHEHDSKYPTTEKVKDVIRQLVGDEHIPEKFEGVYRRLEALEEQKGFLTAEDIQNTLKDFPTTQVVKDQMAKFLTQVKTLVDKKADKEYVDGRFSHKATKSELDAEKKRIDGISEHMKGMATKKDLEKEAERITHLQNRVEQHYPTKSDLAKVDDEVRRRVTHAEWNPVHEIVKENKRGVEDLRTKLAEKADKDHKHPEYDLAEELNSIRENLGKASTREELAELSGRLASVEEKLNAPDGECEFVRTGTYIKLVEAVDELRGAFDELEERFEDHNHDDLYASKSDLAGKANAGHDHDEKYAPISHPHPELEDAQRQAGEYINELGRRLDSLEASAERQLEGIREAVRGISPRLGEAVADIYNTFRAELAEGRREMEENFSNMFVTPRCLAHQLAGILTPEQKDILENLGERVANAVQNGNIARLNGLRADLDQLREQLQQYQAANPRAGGDVPDGIEAVEGLAQDVENLQTGYRDIFGQLGAINATLGQHNERIADLEAGHIHLGDRFAELHGRYAAHERDRDAHGIGRLYDIFRDFQEMMADHLNDADAHGVGGVSGRLDGHINNNAIHGAGAPAPAQPNPAPAQPAPQPRAPAPPAPVVLPPAAGNRFLTHLANNWGRYLGGLGTAGALGLVSFLVYNYITGPENLRLGKYEIVGAHYDTGSDPSDPSKARDSWLILDINEPGDTDEPFQIVVPGGRSGIGGLKKMSDNVEGKTIEITGSIRKTFKARGAPRGWRHVVYPGDFEIDDARSLYGSRPRLPEGPVGPAATPEPPQEEAGPSEPASKAPPGDTMLPRHMGRKQMRSVMRQHRPGRRHC